MPVNNETDSIVLQNVINTLCDWSDDLSMKFNSGKCKVMHVGGRNNHFTYTMHGFAPGGTALESVDEEKDVGVNTLKPSSQCQSEAMNANQLVGQMSRSFTYQDKYNWIRLYEVYVRPNLEYVRPNLEYAVQAWSPWNQKDIDLLEDVEKELWEWPLNLKMKRGANLSISNFFFQLELLKAETNCLRQLRGPWPYLLLKTVMSSIKMEPWIQNNKRWDLTHHFILARCRTLAEELSTYQRINVRSNMVFWWAG